MSAIVDSKIASNPESHPFQAVEFERRGHVAWITMNRPEARNALNIDMRNELVMCFEYAQQEAGIWAVVITGADPAFCAGADLKEKLDLAGSDADAERQKSSDELYLTMRRCYKPIVAAINGPCLAQGAGIALLSDIRIMSERAFMGWPQVKRGISSMSGPLILTECVPVSFATRYLLTGDYIQPADAARVDLAHEVVPHENLLDAASKWLDRIMENAPLSMCALKEVSVKRRGLTFDEAMPMGREVSDRIMESEDAIEGLKAFKEKRKPNWTGV